MKLNHKIRIVLITILLFGCKNMAPEFTGGDTGTPACTPQFPDKNITYDNFVKGILTNHCIICHQGGNSPGPGNFTTYSGVLAYTGFFTLRVTQDRADMPQGNAPLPQSTRDSLNVWINNCTPEK